MCAKAQNCFQNVWAILRPLHPSWRFTRSINTVKALTIPAVLLNFVQPTKNILLFFCNLIPLNICAACTEKCCTGDFQILLNPLTVYQETVVRGSKEGKRKQSTGRTVGPTPTSTFLLWGLQTQYHFT